MIDGSTLPAVRATATRPVLDDCPELAELLDKLDAIDRATARAVRLLGRLQRTCEVEAATGLPVELWLSAEGRRTRSDRRATAAEVLEGLPHVDEAFAAGQLSWAQVRAIALVCVRLPGHVRAHIDRELGARLASFEDADPDDVVALVRQAAASFDGQVSERDVPAVTPEDRFVYLQPRLDGSGGSVYGELDALGLATFAQATDPGPPPPRTEPETVRSQAGRRADRLIDVLAASLAGDEPAATSRRADPSGPPRGGSDGSLLPVAPTLLLTATLDSLLGRDDTPAELLVGLAGGRLKVPSEVARRLLDDGGAAARLLVVDDTGAVLGVGRRHRRPPRWLADATLALDATCAEPGCDRPAIQCDVDHIRPWDAGGRTDLPNLQRLCASANRIRDKAGWDVQPQPDGSRLWTHHRSGVTVRNLPATLRLPPPRGPQDAPVPGGQDPSAPPRVQPDGRDPPASPRVPPDGRDPPARQ